jgi:DNA-binding LytR/AlgR family response regulator
MKILIIEDELPARERLRQMVSAFDPEIEIVAAPGSIRDCLAWLESHPEPDLALADIQLSDGLSFEIFEKHPVKCPVIFATAYDEYIMQALGHNGIDYLLKPIKIEQLHRALGKYLRLKAHFAGDLLSLIRELKGTKPAYRSRFTAKKGLEFVSIPADQIAFFYTEHKLVFLIERSGTKYVLDKPLYELEEDLDPDRFFRINRKYIASVEAIRKFRPHAKGKLLVELDPTVGEQVIVSQERAAAFREWLER